MFVRQFVHESLGNSSYLVGSIESGVAAVIDPQRDIDQYLRAAREQGVRITHVFDTHVHNDYLSGGRELSAALGAKVLMNREAGLQYPHEGLSHGERVRVGDVTIETRRTPGHTPEHMAYVAYDKSGEPRAVFTGGSLLVGGVARSDLLGKDQAPGLARAMFNSVHTQIMTLPGDVAVYPTHGGGSFCIAGGSQERTSTIREQQFANPVLQIASADDFADAVLFGLPPHPRYYARMAPINRAGPRVLGSLPSLKPLTPQQVDGLMRDGVTLIDARAPVRFVEGHIPGSVSVDLGSSFASWTGWLMPLETRLAFVLEGPSSADEAVRQLVRIGFERLEGYLEGGMEAWKRAGLPWREMVLETPETLRKRLAEDGGALQLLDVRFPDEYRNAHIPGARHVMLADIEEALAGLDRGKEVRTICAVGPRATTAASLLERAGFQGVAPVLGGTSGWRSAGYPTDPAAAQAEGQDGPQITQIAQMGNEETTSPAGRGLRAQTRRSERR